MDKGFNYSMRELNEQRVDIILEEWRNIAGEDEFSLELEPMFDWCRSHTEQKDGDSRAWELYDPKSDECCAIVEIVDSRRGGLSKLLKLFVTPQFWDMDNNRKCVIEIYMATFFEVTKKGILVGAERVKLYGRTDLMLSILTSIHARSMEASWPKNIKAGIEGRWLTLSFS